MASVTGSIGLMALAVAAASAVSCAAQTATATTSPARQPPPNIVLVLIDDLGAHDLHCTGSFWYETPAIDKLAADGMTFTQAYAACAVCSPTRASLITGQYPQRLNITDWIPGEGDRPDNKLKDPKIDNQLRTGVSTIARELRRGGYATGYVGKWHLGGKGSLPVDHGFDFQIAAGHIGHPAGYHYPYGKEGASHRVPDLQAGGAEGEYLTDRLTTEALRFIDDNRQRPFFLMLSHYAVHTPLQGKEEDVEYFTGKARIDGQNNPVYAAMIRSVDQSVDRLRRRLDELGLTGRTIIIFTSDNGGLEPEATDNRPLRAGKGFQYEGGLRVPLIVSWPGVTRAGSTSSVPVCSFDLAPTLYDAAAVGFDKSPTLDGLDLRNLLSGQSATLPERDLFWHYPHYWRGQVVRPYGVVRSGSHKLIEYYEDGRVELFDLAADPAEERDLAAQQPELAEQLREKLHAWRKRVNAQMPTPNG